MAIPSSRLNFRLTFIQHTQTMPVLAFDEQEWPEEQQSTAITENVDLSVLFSSDDPHARFYMSGLDSLPAEAVKVDEQGMAYLSPTLEPYELFKNTGEYYPLIPGYYPVIVETQGVRYYASVQVLPKQMTLEQWEIMRDELEQELRGLAQDMLRKRLGVDHLQQALPPQLMHRYTVIQKHFPTVMAALHDLTDKANFRIRKEYRMIPVERAKSIDEVTVRHHLSHPEKREALKVPVREVDYDLPENQWVRRILQMTSRYLDEIMEAADEQSQWQPILDNARKMKHSLQLLRTTPWFEEVSPFARQVSLPPVLMYDPRYRTLYQLYRELEAEEPMDWTLDTSFVKQWKRTDLLYEMWGFLQLCKALSKSLGYEAVSGWLFDLQTQSRLAIPSLPPETQIIFAQGDVRLCLTYDAMLPSRREETDLKGTPLFTVDIHNRPDGRLDVYKGETYVGSMVFDFKYRPKHWFWDPSKRVITRPAAMGQLLAYGHGCASTHLLVGQLPDAIRERMRPVLEVWAIYPSDRSSDAVQYDEDYRVRLVRATPGEENDHLAEELQKGITELLEQV